MVTVWVLRPAKCDRAAIIAHAAGNDMNNRLLVDVQNSLAENSVAAVRFNFLYTEEANALQTGDRLS